MVITLLGFLKILVLKILKKLNFDLKIGMLKCCLKILLNLHTVLHLKFDCRSVQDDHLEKNKIHFKGFIWGQGQMRAQQYF